MTYVFVPILFFLAILLVTGMTLIVDAARRAIRAAAIKGWRSNHGLHV